MDEENRRRITQIAAGDHDAEAARNLLEAERFGTLCTLAVDHPGYPFGSVVPYAPSEDGEIIIQASLLAEHTRNFKADPRAALFVRDTSRAEVDPQVLPRVTVLGDISPAGEAVAEIFYGRHPKARSYSRMSDFSFYILEVQAVRFVGGFGNMSWIDEDT